MLDPGMARVTVLAGGVPRPDHPVTFQAPDGTEIATVRTDASGVAAVTVPEGSYVTAYDIYRLGGNRRSIVSVMGVKPGDTIELRGDADVPQRDLQFAYPAYAGATTYEVSSTCAADGVGESTMPSLSSAPCSPRVDTLVAAADDNGNNLAYLAKLDQPFDQLIDLTGETWIAPTLTYSSYTNPPVFTETRATRHYTTERGVFASCESGQPDGAYDFSCPTVPGATIIEELWMWESSVGHHVYSLAPSAPVDLAGTAITGPTSSGVLAQGPTLTWTERAGVAPQFVIAQVDASGANENPYQWNIVAPYGGASLPLPTLVGEGVMYMNPGEGGGTLWLGTADGGYDAIRQLGPVLYGAPRVNAETGRIVLSAYES